MTTEQRHFNLLDEPWIVVETLEAETRTVGIRELFATSHRLRRLAGELPTQDFAVLRVLLAIAYQSYDPRPAPAPLTRWRALWELDALPMAPVEAYLQRFEHRFDLLDPVVPFMQVADLHTAKHEWRDLALIVADADPDGALFTMRSRLDALSYAEAARWLVHAHSFDFSGIKSGAVGDDRAKGGKGYPMGLGWCGWLGGTWLEGEDLRETLLLNTVFRDSGRSRKDVPIWEEPQLTAAERPVDERGPFGQLGLLTWQQRRIRLQLGDGEVIGVLVSNGDPIDYTLQVTHERMSAWRLSEPQTNKAKAIRYMPRALEPGRSLWRGLSTLLPDGSAATTKTRYGTEKSSLPAGVVEWLRDLTGEAISPQKRVNVRVVSMVYGSNNSSFDNLVDDRLRFAAVLASVEGEHVRGVAVEAARRADAVAVAIRQLANGLAEAAGGDAGHAGAAAQQRLYAVLDTEYPAWLAALDSDGADAALIAWTEWLRRQAMQLSRALVADAGPAAWAGRSVSIAGTERRRVVSVGTAARRFEWNLREALPATSDSAGAADDGDARTPDDHELELS